MSRTGRRFWLPMSRLPSHDCTWRRPPVAVEWRKCWYWRMGSCSWYDPHTCIMGNRCGECALVRIRWGTVEKPHRSITSSRHTIGRFFQSFHLIFFPADKWIYLILSGILYDTLRHGSGYKSNESSKQIGTKRVFNTLNFVFQRCSLQWTNILKLKACLDHVAGIPLSFLQGMWGHVLSIFFVSTYRGDRGRNHHL